jgi:hypothetical protein
MAPKIQNAEQTKRVLHQYPCYYSETVCFPVVCKRPPSYLETLKYKRPREKTGNSLIYSDRREFHVTRLKHDDLHDKKHIIMNVIVKYVKI